MKRALIALALPGAAALADDLDALRLADSAAPAVVAARDWQAAFELAGGRATLRDGNAASRRIALEVALDKTIAPDWRALVSGRFDGSWQAPGDYRGVSTLRHAYLSWQADPANLVDFGQINDVEGIANGYNPSDFLRERAVRAPVSADPASMKKNRQGSVMLRAQHLWADGALTALVAPRLGRDSGSLVPAAGDTNGRTRWLIRASKDLGDGFAPQWLVAGSPGQAPQFGVNLSALPDPSTVLYAEWVGGRGVPQQALALHGDAAEAWQTRLAVGATHTRTNKLALTLEYQYDSAAPAKAEWDALRRAPLRYAAYRAWQHNAQELPTRAELFAYATWPDAGGCNRLDLSAMLKYNLTDDSRMGWLESRYRLDHADLALRWQRQTGRADSAYGAAVPQATWQMLVKYYF